MLFGILMNLGLFGLKLALGLIFASVSVKADGFNNLSDALNCILVILAFRLSLRPADEDHPYGHARMEYISGMIASFLVLLFGLSLLKESVTGLFQKEEVIQDWLMLPLLALAAFVKLFFYFYYRHMAERLDSPSLKASSVDSLTDVFATTGVIIGGVLCYLIGDSRVDSLFGVAVSALILWTGAKLFKETTDLILGKAPPKELSERILEIAKEDRSLLGIHDLLIHSYGPGHVMASLHAEVDGSRNLLDVHEAADRMEREVLKETGVVLTVHIDPVNLEDPVRKEYETGLEAWLKESHPDFGIHDLRLRKDREHVRVTFDLSVPFSERRDSETIRVLLTDELKTLYPETDFILTVDRH